MRTKLLTVKEALVVEGRGAILTPWIEKCDFGDGMVETFVLLRKPDGTESRVFARFIAQHARDPDRIAFGCIVPEAKEGDVPAGSELFRISNESA